MFMFEKLCRLCITDENVSSTLNNSDSDNIILLDKLNRIAPGLLKINSSLPIGICTTCIAQLNQACKFIKNCLRSQEILNKYLEQLQNGLDTEQGENSEIKIIAIKLEQNKMINYMKYMNIEQTEVEFPNTLVNYEEESGFIKKENIIEYNDDYESIQVNFEDDIKEAETNVKMEISDEEYNYSINMQSNIDVKEELESLSDDIIDIKNEIIEEHLYETNIIDYECTEVKCEDEIKIEDHDSKNSFVDIPTITEQSDFCGFNLTEYSLANDIKVKYNFELNRLCENTNKFLIDFQNEKKSSNSKNLKNDIDHLKNVRKALERSSTRKPRQNSSKDSLDVNVNIQSCTIRAPNMFRIGYRGKSETNLKQHIGNRPSDNLDTRQVPCPICKKLYASKNSLCQHMKLHNASDMRHKCLICTKSFVKKCNFNDHMRRHTGERPHKCEHCDKAFASISNCRRHVRTHTGERPFQCKFCEKKFGDSSALLKHTRIHTGKRPYKCEQCAKTFIRSDHYKRHLKVHRDRTAGKIN